MVDSPCWGVSTGKYAGVSTVDPTKVTDDHWVRTKPPCAPSDQKTRGKWLIFKQFEELDKTWHMIREAVESGELHSTGAKCSTAKPDPSSHPMDSNEGVICVYTSEETMDEVGFKLVHMVKQDIRYKTDKATRQGKYIALGYKKVTIKTIFWNDGEPSLKTTEGGDQDDRTMGDWRQGMGDGERSPPPHHSQRGYHYHGGRGYDQYSDYGHSQRYERGSHYRDTYSSDGYAQRRSFEGHHERDRRGEPPKERPRLQLQPRTKPLGDTSSGRERGEERASSSIFGQAKPVDTAAKEREIEERLLRLDIGQGGGRMDEGEERQASGRECDRPKGRRKDCHPGLTHFEIK